MPKGIAKENLPAKICATCGRRFTWRKKWARDWEAVKYCSDRCRSGVGGRPLAGKGGAGEGI